MVRVVPRKRGLARSTKEGVDPFVVVAAAAVVAALWLRPLTSSLWLDELGTWWVIKDGLGDAVERAFTYHGQSPAYYVVAWTTIRLFGASEAALRLPSLVAMALGVILAYRLSLRLFDRDTARLSAFTVVCSGALAFSASDARPYAFAVTASIGATLALVRWLDDGTKRSAVVYVAVAGLMLWFHYFAALALIAHVVYAFLRLRDGDARVSSRGLLLAAGGVFLLVLPLIGQLASLWDRRVSLSTPHDVGLADLVSALLEVSVAVGLLLGGLVAAATGSIAFDPVPTRRRSLALLGAWSVVPSTALFLVSAVSPVSLMSPRYYVVAAPATAILTAWLIASLTPPRASRVVALVFAIVAVAAFSSSSKNREDWAAAASFVRATTTGEAPVFLHPAFIESAQLDWLRDPTHASYLASPVAFYPMTDDVRVVPYGFDTATVEYMEAELDRATHDGRPFLFVTREPTVPWAAWFIGGVRDEGWTGALAGRFGVIEVWSFTPA